MLLKPNYSFRNLLIFLSNCEITQRKCIVRIFITLFLFEYILVILIYFLCDETTHKLRIPQSFNLIIFIQIILNNLLVDKYSFSIALLFEEDVSYPLSLSIVFGLDKGDYLLFSQLHLGLCYFEGLACVTTHLIILYFNCV